MALTNITFKAVGENYVSDSIQVNQESIGIQLKFDTGSSLTVSISYDGENFQSIDKRMCGKIFARPVVGLKKGQYLRLECTEQPTQSQYFESEE